MSFWIQTRTALLDAASTMVGFGVNWLIQSTLVILVGLVAARLLASRGAAAESIVYRTTLVAILFCPLVTWLLTHAGFSGWSIQMPTAWNYERFDGRLAEEAQPSNPHDSGIFLGPTDIPSRQSPDVLAPAPDHLAMASAATKQPPHEISSPLLASPTGSVTTSAASGDSVQQTIAPYQSSVLAIHPFGWTAISLAVVWVFVTFGLLARLVISIHRLAQLSRHAHAAEPQTMSLCQELAQRIGVTAPSVLRTPLLPSPCLAGLLKPKILLTDQELSLSARDVLIHELAHLRRRDCHWNLLRHIATSLFYFQPLIWTLSRRLERAAEEVCDDYVVQFGGDREEYARHLVDIAELSTIPVGATAVGIVSLRSLLARRVIRILDTSRSLSTCVGHQLLGLVLVGGVLGTATVGLVGIEARALAETAQQEADSRRDNDGRAEAAEQGEGTNQPVSVAAEVTDGKSLIITGSILGPTGAPANGAYVSAVGIPTAPRRGGDLYHYDGNTLADVRANEQGQFKLSLSDSVTSTSHAYVQLIARHDDAAIAWTPVALDTGTLEVSLQLQVEEPLHGRLVDIEGNPATGVRLRTMAMERVADSEPTAIWYIGNDNSLAWPPPVASDGDGRFAIHGVPRESKVVLLTSGDDRFATQEISLNTGMPEAQSAEERRYRPLAMTSSEGEEFIIPLSPAQIFAGTVRYEDTGQPVPHARITIWASQQELGGLMTSVAGVADDQGRYRIVPYPGITFGVTAYPPDSAPYLARRAAGNQPIRWNTRDQVKNVDLNLPRGVLVRGLITEMGTDAPIAGASVQYEPEYSNPYASDEIVTAWQGVQVSNERGEFEIVVPPGPGRLLAHGQEAEYVLQQTTSLEMGRGQSQPGGRRHYAHAIVVVNFESEEEAADLSIKLQPGATVSGSIVDEQNNPADNVRIFSRLVIRTPETTWTGNTNPTQNGKFTVGGLAEGEQYPVHFLDPERQLGATVILHESSGAQTVVLKPCGKAIMRFVDDQGEPIAGHWETVEMVVTPGGPTHLSRDSLSKGVVSADANFITSMDWTNYGKGIVANDDGVMELPVLIPGASYRIVGGHGVVDGNTEWHVIKDFQVQAGETLDLGDIVVERRK